MEEADAGALGENDSCFLKCYLFDGLTEDMRMVIAQSIDDTDLIRSLDTVRSIIETATAYFDDCHVDLGHSEAKHDDGHRCFIVGWQSSDRLSHRFDKGEDCLTGSHESLGIDILIIDLDSLTEIDKMWRDMEAHLIVVGIEKM